MRSQCKVFFMLMAFFAISVYGEVADRKVQLEKDGPAVSIPQPKKPKEKMFLITFQLSGRSLFIGGNLIFKTVKLDEKSIVSIKQKAAAILTDQNTWPHYTYNLRYFVPVHNDIAGKVVITHIYEIEGEEK